LVVIVDCQNIDDDISAIDKTDFTQAANERRSPGHVWSLCRRRPAYTDALAKGYGAAAAAIHGAADGFGRMVIVTVCDKRSGD
jgi:hypothetical protein